MGQGFHRDMRRQDAALLPESGLHRDTLATLGAPAREHRLSALGFHPATKSVRLGAATPVGLERALRHEMIYSSSVERIMLGPIEEYI